MQGSLSLIKPSFLASLTLPYTHEYAPLFLPPPIQTSYCLFLSFQLPPFKTREMISVGRWLSIPMALLILTALKISSVLYGHYFGSYVSSSSPTLSCLKISEHKIPLCARIARFSDHHFLVKIFI